MSRSPSPSTSKIAAERVPRAPQMRDPSGRARRIRDGRLSLPDASSSNHGVDHAARARLDAEHELRVDEPLAAVVQLHRIDHVAVRDSSCRTR